MLTRVVDGVTTTFAYNADNKLTTVSRGGSTLATFVYDGDGARVQSTINGVTTKFVGEYYEVTDSVVTKYYGGSAMRVDGTLYYLLSDHLGSNSLILDTAGNVVGETRYTAWGEERYSSGTVSTDYTYTGQYSNTDDFGLMYYKARWYDPILGRFAQADSIVPGAGNPLAWDRYAYVKNNPVLYIDPTGHQWICIGANKDHCYDDGNGDISGMATSIGTQNMKRLGIYGLGNEQAALDYLVSMEFSSGTINETIFSAAGTQGYDLLQGIKNRYAEYCSESAWSQQCISNFWEYHEPILKGLEAHGAGYYSDDQTALIPQVTQEILEGTQDPNAGCAADSANFCQYALAKPDLVAWAQNRSMNITGEGSWSYNIAENPSEILHLYNNYDSYFTTMSQAMYGSFFNPNSQNYCPGCVY